MALVRVTALKDFLTNPLSTADASTGYQLGALTSGQYVYGGLHLTSVSLGTTARMLIPTIQSATASAFGAPSNRITFALSTAPGAEWGARVGGLSTEHSWWRLSWALSTAVSTGGTWRGLAYMGIR